MTDEKKLRAIKDLLISAEKAVNSAKKILATMTGPEDKKDLEILSSVDSLYSYNDGEDKVVEGVFTGEAMLGSDKNIYPVPQNYASKSHLVQGSKLKAIIKPDGKILYKIIEEIEFESKVGIIAKNKERFQVLVDGQAYNVLLAAITYFKCEIGDSITVRIPKGKEATYAAIEAVIPKV
ncbi:MAG: hypothetical protein PHF46_02830 [Candidatus Gracilibacteria bacterium]|nr:hypothetical protein [Candidatus Gracilibacteria bacterium]MDD3120318.1 hypothetical protein [Candidatus Gracilibacteria bacterium]MDD4530843.1 hypothetical protein [Candidatus Gracilibacteria bacterium]